MEEQVQKSHCATCEKNVGNICKSQSGYYFYGEAIGDEEVDCDGWILNPYAYPIQIQYKTKK